MNRTDRKRAGRRKTFIKTTSDNPSTASKRGIITVKLKAWNKMIIITSEDTGYGVVVECMGC